MLVTAPTGGTAAGVLGSSNYDDAGEVEGGGGNASVTQEGNPANQVALPVFANPATGDFHQVQGSPTIDAGNGAVSLLGTQDFDRDARVLGGAIDIGADEFVPPSAGEPDTRAPFTLISKQPKKKTRKRKAKFTFGSDQPGSTFECSLDDGPFEPCTSPLKYRRLEGGKHVFAVRGIDPAGNVGAAVEAKWKIRRRNR